MLSTVGTVVTVIGSDLLEPRGVEVSADRGIQAEAGIASGANVGQVLCIAIIGESGVIQPVAGRDRVGDIDGVEKVLG